MRGDALARAGEAEALLGRRLDADAVHVHVHALRPVRQLTATANAISDGQCARLRRICAMCGASFGA